METPDYLLDISQLNIPELLAHWDWLLGPDITVRPWLMNLFGDLFFVDETGIVNWLNITDGELSEVAESSEVFTRMLDADEFLEEWFLFDLVHELADILPPLQPGQCFGFRTLPIIGGDFGAQNVSIGSIEDYWEFCGHVHSQIHGLPEGAEIDIDLPERDFGH